VRHLAVTVTRVTPVSAARTVWDSGSFFSKLKAQHDYALATGALQPIETQLEYLPAGDIQFAVRILANVSRKEKARQQQGKTTPANPFLPYEQALYVSDISPTHLCLLNKFNVVDYHFLIVTRQFEAQDSWLNLADFEALVRCLQAVDGLAFFNGGTMAGSSQPHKHLQVVPYTESLTAFPMEQVMMSPSCVEEPDPAEESDLAEEPDSKKGRMALVTSPLLPFRHAILRGLSVTGLSLKELSLKELSEPLSAQHYLACYHRLLTAVGITGSYGHGLQTAAYNLLCTRQWMLIVPRSQEKYGHISVNALGFAGSLLVRNPEMLAQLRALTPMGLLQQVGYSR
jgi:sulfate adenylyltransferase (ADP) / ATP adenylyltransferase